jgi:hypothetical protein
MRAHIVALDTEEWRSGMNNSSASWQCSMS